MWKSNLKAQRMECKETTATFDDGLNGTDEPLRHIG